MVCVKSLGVDFSPNNYKQHTNNCTCKALWSLQITFCLFIYSCHLIPKLRRSIKLALLCALKIFVHSCQRHWTEPEEPMFSSPLQDPLRQMFMENVITEITSPCLTLEGGLWLIFAWGWTGPPQGSKALYWTGQEEQPINPAIISSCPLKALWMQAHRK